jgi:hypothetical protein
MKGNKLIAEFMALEVEDGLYYYTTSMDDYKTDTLYFDSSWDWLMPVVDKCFDLSFEDGVWSTREYDNSIHKLNDALVTANIDAVYQAVVEFIKYTNLNQQI